jgi:hypothetical protein
MDVSVLLSNGAVVGVAFLCVIFLLRLIPPVLYVVLLRPGLLGYGVWLLVTGAGGRLRWFLWFAVVGLLTLTILEVLEVRQLVKRLRADPDYHNKLAAENRERSYFHLNPYVAGRLGLHPHKDLWRAVLAFGLLFGLIPARDLGFRRASLETEFYVDAQSPGWVLVRSFGDRAVLATVDRRSGQVGPDYRVLNLGSGPGLSLRLERLGQLHAMLDSTRGL